MDKGHYMNITSLLETAHIELRDLVSTEANPELILIRAKQIILAGDIEDLNYQIDPEDNLEERAQALIDRIPKV